MIRCEFENRSKASLRHVTVGSIIVNHNNQVLLVKRAPHLPNGMKYTIPGGFVDRDENTKQAALRELREETGLDGEIISLFRINDNPKRPKEDRQNIDFIYIVKITAGLEKLNDEVTNIEWFSKEALPSEDEFAFDHRESILFYFRYLEKSFSLPLLQ